MTEELITNDPRVPAVPEAPHQGVHTGERVDAETAELIRRLYAAGSSPHAVSKAVGCTRKTVLALCCPEKLHRQATLEQIAEVRRLRDEGVDFLQIAEEMDMKLQAVTAIAMSDSEVVMELQRTRAARALVFEAVGIEATQSAIERRWKEGKLSVAEGSNATMIANTMVRDTIGAAPIRVRIEADEHVLAAMTLFGGGGKALPVKSGAVHEAEILPNKDTQTQPAENASDQMAASEKHRIENK